MSARLNLHGQISCNEPQVAPGGGVRRRVPAARPGPGWPFGLFLVALALRLVHFWTVRETPFFTDLGLDPLAYDEWGQRIAAGHWLGDEVFYQDPLYPYFLGVIYRLAGHSYSAVVLVQCLLGALVAPMVYLAARTGLGSKEAILAGTLAAAYAPAIYYDGLLLKTWLGSFLVAALLLAIGRARRSSALSWGAAGLLLGLGCLVRGNLLICLPVLAGWLLLHRRGNESHRSQGHLIHEMTRRLRHPQAWRSVGALALGSTLILFPTALRNRVVGGEWVLTTAQAGPNFYLGNNPTNTTGRYEPLPFVGANPKYERRGFTAEAERRTGRPMTAAEVSRFWFAESWRWIRAYPGDWLMLTWWKLRAYWGAYEVPDNLDYYLYRTSAPVLRLPLPGFGLVAPLGLLGLWTVRRHSGWPRLLSLFVLVYSGSVILFFVFSRYRLPVMPALFPLAAAASLDLVQRFRALRRGKGAGALVRGLALAGLLFAFVNVPVHAPADSWTFAVAKTFSLPRRAENSAIGHFNLGLSYAHRAESADDPTPLMQKAAEEFREATRQDPFAAAPFAELGKVLARLQRDQEAIEAYRTVIRLDPDRPRPHHVLGMLYRRVGDAGAAERSFRRALQLNPERADTAVALGELLLQRGARRAAAAAFRQALRGEPDNAAARDGLRMATNP